MNPKHPSQCRYYVNYEKHIHHLEPTDYTRKAVFIDTSLAELSHWVYSHETGVLEDPQVEELIIINQEWDDVDASGEGTSSTRSPGIVPLYMELPRLRTLKVAGCPQDIFALLGLLSAPNLEFLEIRVHCQGSELQEPCLDFLLEELREACMPIPVTWVTITVNEDEAPCDFEKEGVFRSLPAGMLAKLPFCR